jgi:nicotinic acid mononucleotide adenylyltransferase
MPGNHKIYQIPYHDCEEFSENHWKLEALLQRIEKLLETNRQDGQPKHKVCLAIAGGGGTALSSLAATSGASQLLLEGTVTYDRSSYNTFVRKNSSSLSSLDDASESSATTKFSYTSMTAAKLASMSALWRGMELQNLNAAAAAGGGNADSMTHAALLHTIGVGAASTLQTTTAGATSRTGRPSFGNIVATRGDGQQMALRFTLNHQKEGDDSASVALPPRFAQDVMVSHLIVQSLEQFLGGDSTILQQYDVAESAVDATDFPGVTVQQWTTNVMADMDEADRETATLNDPVQAAANRILGGQNRAVLLVPKENNESDAAIEPNSFLQPIVFPVLPSDCLIFPGSFNPPHHGHLALAQAAIKAVQNQRQSFSSPKVPMIVFELSIINADKPPMESQEVARRVTLFKHLLFNNDYEITSWGILLTSAPLFSDKVQTLRQVAPVSSQTSAFTTQHMQDNSETSSSRWSFVIGTDTMVRILNPKYYSDDSAQMMASLREMDVQFVVGGRLNQSKDKDSNEFVTGEAELEDQPTDIRDMFLLLDEADFRVDVSSTELRAKMLLARNGTVDDDDTHGRSGHGSNDPPSKRKGKGGTALGMNGVSKLLHFLLTVGVSILALGLPTCEAQTRISRNESVVSRRGRIYHGEATANYVLDAVSTFAAHHELDSSRRALKDKKSLEAASQIGEESTSSGEEICTPVGKCEQCTFSEMKAYEACKETGRWEKYECKMSGEVEASTRTEMRSCKYTESDEEFAMIRLQMLCFLIGSIAVASVRKQKRVSASLFDQRKQATNGAAQSNGIPSKKNSSFVTANDDEEIEFTPMTNQEREMVPLTRISEEDLEVV